MIVYTKPRVLKDKSTTLIYLFSFSDSKIYFPETELKLFFCKYNSFFLKQNEESIPASYLIFLYKYLMHKRLFLKDYYSRDLISWWYLYWLKLKELLQHYAHLNLSKTNRVLINYRDLRKRKSNVYIKGSSSKTRTIFVQTEWLRKLFERFRILKSLESLDKTSFRFDTSVACFVSFKLSNSSSPFLWARFIKVFIKILDFLMADSFGLALIYFISSMLLSEFKGFYSASAELRCN